MGQKGEFWKKGQKWPFRTNSYFSKKTKLSLFDPQTITLPYSYLIALSKDRVIHTSMLDTDTDTAYTIHMGIRALKALSNNHYQMDTFVIISNVRKDLAKRNAIKRFLAVTERSKEFVFVLIQFLVATAVIAYFLAHFIVYLTNAKYPQQQVYIYQHAPVIAHH